MPFSAPPDVIRACSEVLRTKNASPKDLNSATVLEIVYNVLSGDGDAVVDTATRAVKRSPDFAFGHYALTRMCAGERRRRAAQAGLRHANALSTWLHGNLLARRGMNAAELANAILHSGSGDENDRARILGRAFLRCAERDIDAFVDLVPPDSGVLPALLGLRVSVMLSLNGHMLSKDLEEVKVSSWETSCDKNGIADKTQWPFLPV